MVHAVVVPDSEDSLDVQNIDTVCRTKLTGYKLPRGVTLLSELPRNAAGKILKKILRAHFDA